MKEMELDNYTANGTFFQTLLAPPPLDLLSKLLCYVNQLAHTSFLLRSKCKVLTKNGFVVLVPKVSVSISSLRLPCLAPITNLLIHLHLTHNKKVIRVLSSVSHVAHCKKLFENPRIPTLVYLNMCELLS